jgi:hypothetical protein
MLFINHPHAESASLSNDFFDVIKFILGVFEPTKIALLFYSGK